MIEAINLSKTFESFTALDGFHSRIPAGSVYGLVGSNGSGKSTLLRLVSGIYRPDSGEIRVQDTNPFENPAIKDRIFHVADDPYFFQQSTMDEMARFYRGLYSGFREDLYRELCQRFPIDPSKRINTFSKGMKRQVSLILAMACRPDYLLLDEVFDGLDPIMRGALRKLLADQIADRGMTVVLASHNLRELEDMCDHMGLLHRGSILFEKEIDDVKLGFCKVQAAFGSMPGPEAWESLNILKKNENGSVINLIVRGASGEVLDYIHTLKPLFAESLPLTLEEVFIQEMEAVGYDYNNILFS